MFRFIRAITLSYLKIFTAGEKLNFIQIIYTLNNVSSIFALFTGLSVSIMGHSIMQLYSNYIQIRYINKDIDIVSMQSLVSKSIKRLISILPEDVLLSRKFFSMQDGNIFENLTSVSIAIHNEEHVQK